MQGPTDQPTVPPPPDQFPGVVLRRFFTTRKGNTFDAWDYGHKAWPIGKRKRR